MTCVCSGRGFIFVGDDAGRIHFVNRRMEVQTVKLFEGNVEQMLQVINLTIYTDMGTAKFDSGVRRTKLTYKHVLYHLRCAKQVC